MLAHLASIGLVSATGGYVRPPTDFGELADERSAVVTSLAGEALATVPLDGKVFVEELKLRLKEELGIAPRFQRLSVAGWDQHLPDRVLLEDAFPEPGVANLAQLLVSADWQYCDPAELEADAYEQGERKDRLEYNYPLEVIHLHKELGIFLRNYKMWFAFEEAFGEEDLRNLVAVLSSYIQDVRNHGYNAPLDLFRALNDILGYARHVFCQAKPFGVFYQLKQLISAEPIRANLQAIREVLHQRCISYRGQLERKMLVQRQGGRYSAGMGTDFSLITKDGLHSLETARKDLEQLLLSGRTGGSNFERFWADA